MNTRDWLDQEVRHDQPKEHLEHHRKKSQLQRMRQRYLEGRVREELEIIVESDVCGMARIDEGLIGKRGQDSLNRRVKVQPQDHEKGGQDEPVTETPPAETLPKCE